MKKSIPQFEGELDSVTPEIYLSVDHLKNGDYVFHFILKNKVIKSVTIAKK